MVIVLINLYIIMADNIKDPKSRQENKGQGKFNKKYTDVKYNTKRVRSYERLIASSKDKKL